jgi:hypothetical protein
VPTPALWHLAPQARTPLAALMDVDMLPSRKLVSWLSKPANAVSMTKVGAPHVLHFCPGCACRWQGWLGGVDRLQYVGVYGPERR